MKPSNRIALMFSLSAALLCGSAFAQDTAAPAKHMHHHKAQSMAVNGSKYDNCLKEKLAVAEAFCSSHSTDCKAEKDGAAKQCRSEARGERQKG